jgi:NAD(P)-dependent dehydrogenase (short-subunit alcohol dehydrogenase family)
MPQVEALKEELQRFGVPVHFHNGNAASDTEREAAIAALSSRLGETDGQVAMLLHSLAFGTLRPYLGEGATIQKRHLDMTLDVMAHSLVYWTQDIVRQGLMGSGGRIFAMTSSGSLAVWPSYGAVSAAKCALESHIRQLALELAPAGITANAIMAGVTKTPALEKIPGAEEIATRALERNPHGRLTRPSDIAELLLTLCHPSTAWLTGNTLRVDGGEAISG